MSIYLLENVKFLHQKNGRNEGEREKKMRQRERNRRRRKS